MLWIDVKIYSLFRLDHGEIVSVRLQIHAERGGRSDDDAGVPRENSLLPCDGFVENHFQGIFSGALFRAVDGTGFQEFLERTLVAVDTARVEIVIFRHPVQKMFKGGIDNQIRRRVF